jgi:hypothetical protein
MHSYFSKKMDIFIIGLIEPEDISLNVKMAEKYWHRVSLMKVLALFFVFYTMGLAMPVIVYYFWLNWPHDYLWFGIYSYFEVCLWIWYLTPHTINLILVFHQMCYYLQLRFDSVNELLRNYSISKRGKTIHDLNKILKKHNKICETVKKYNEFWAITLLLDAFLYTSMVLFISYLSFFTQLIPFLRVFFGSFTLIFLLCLCFICYSAISVSTKVLKLHLKK